jgi:hypothetical protein
MGDNPFVINIIKCQGKGGKEDTSEEDNRYRIFEHNDLILIICFQSIK